MAILFGSGNKPQSQQAPAASGVSIQSSVYGKAVPIVYGTTRIAGNLSLYGNFYVQTIVTPSGGGGGKATTAGGGGGLRSRTAQAASRVRGRKHASRRQVRAYAPAGPRWQEGFRWRSIAGDYGPEPPVCAARGRDRKSTHLNSSHIPLSRMPSSA